MKKILAFLLSAAMVMSFFATAVSAQEADAGDVSDLQTDKQIKYMEVDTEGLFDNFPDNDQLFAGYVEQELYGRTQTFGINAAQWLNHQEKQLYDQLKAEIMYVAANGGSTEFYVEASSIDGFAPTFSSSADINAEIAKQIDIPAVWEALVFDCPYDLYWFDKGGNGFLYACNMYGYGDTLTVDGFIFQFCVSANYSGADYLTVKSDVSKVSAAKANARAIAEKHAAKDDYNKLIAYRDEICSLVKYNFDVLYNGNYATDNDPWQLIYVFDGDPSTDVVCEGYSKAFQYLCDISDFDSAKCYTVTGYMDYGSHMWNILKMNDGKNYIADITNSDTDTIGENGGLFLSGVQSGSAQQGYIICGAFYYYDTYVYTDEAGLPAEVLTLSKTDYKYVTPTPTVKPTPVPTAKPTPAPTNPPETNIRTTPMYRLYNPNSGEHFYTGSKEERDNLNAAGWHYEGVAWNAPTNSGAPVYRLYNPNSGDHHYTMSADERDMLVGFGWIYEGVAWNSATAENLPLYRLYNPNADCGSHHYTGSTEERDNLVSVGWIFEGIGWFGMKQ